MILEEIIRYKRLEIERLKEGRPFGYYRRVLDRSAPLLDFKASISIPKRAGSADIGADTASDSSVKATSGAEAAIIAEIKRASPSKGPIADEPLPECRARLYEEGGASAISVLTDYRFFRGSIEDLITVKRSSRLPILRKDFIIDECQVIESWAAGADAILLIASALSVAELMRLHRLAEDLGLDALVEVHTLEEYDLALEAGIGIIGINNRDLRDFRTDIGNTIAILEKRGIPEGRVVVSESGIGSRREIEALMAVGVRSFLVGEALMRSEDPGMLLAELRGACG